MEGGRGRERGWRGEGVEVEWMKERGREVSQREARKGEIDGRGGRRYRPTQRIKMKAYLLFWYFQFN